MPRRWANPFQAAYALTSGNASVASGITELTEYAIRTWRRLAEMDENKAGNVTPALVDSSA
jgi:hypothetical protein